MKSYLILLNTLELLMNLSFKKKQILRDFSQLNLHTQVE